ncbi:MAG TPA: twin-arginine translocase TatA/TatE family subunit [Terriglobales bacterium]|nr:twin-arginine translocase TatA/TatE family subunit [Terriglobales bacterium]
MSFSGMLFLTFLVLIVFGPKKLPHVAKQVGRMLSEWKSVTSDFRSQLEIEMEAAGKQEETAPVPLMQKLLPAETRPSVLENDTSRDGRGRVEASHG